MPAVNSSSQPSPQNPYRDQPSATRPSSSIRPKILIVDDLESTREMLGFVLKQNGFDVLYARDGQAALNLVREQKPAVILLDILMPGLDGLAVCSRIKEEPGLEEIKIVMVTALTSPDEKRQAERSGADAFMEKPVNLKKLVEVVKNITAGGPRR